MVLSRKQEEGIVIGGNVKVTILGIRGSQTRLGIEAPKDVPILRSELANKPSTSIVIGPVASRTGGESVAIAQ